MTGAPAMTLAEKRRQVARHVSADQAVLDFLGTLEVVATSAANAGFHHRVACYGDQVEFIVHLAPSSEA